MVPMVAIVVSVILLLGLFVRASLSNRKLDASFRQEMAQRFDLEKKILSLEKERADLYAQIASLTGQAEKGRSAVMDLQVSLEKALAENKGLKDELARLRDQVEVLQAPAASGTM